MELLGALLIWLWIFSWREGWLGWVAASAAALVGGASLIVALLGLWAASIANGDHNDLRLFWILGFAGLLPLVWRACRGGAASRGQQQARQAGD